MSLPNGSSTHHSNTFRRMLSTENFYPDDSRPLVEASITRDIREASDDSSLASTASFHSDSSETPLNRPQTAPSAGNSYVQSYRRPSFATAGPRGTLITRVRSPIHGLSIEERERAWKEEQGLLRDSHLVTNETRTHISQRHQNTDGKSSMFSRTSTVEDGTKHSTDEESAALISENSALLGNSTLPYGGTAESPAFSSKWEDAVAAGMIQTSWKRETRTIAGYAAPLMVTFLLQYTLTVASIFAVGHIGTTELGAVSLASMSANITGYAVYQGLATSLDTLCAQAYGSGKKKLVGLQMQRMIYFLWLLTIPIGIVWLLADKVLMAFVPETDVARLAGLYLKVVLFGAPGYACFEAGKRFMQAQGLFSASLYVLLFCAPLNAFMNWFFVWRLELGFVGAPIAVAITDNLLPLALFIYVLLIGGRECWPGFTRRAFHNWGPMIKLALPGFIMVEAEVLAFEILTFAASYFGTTVLAAQSVLATLTALTFQVPFTLSIATSTRIANLIGGGLAAPAKTSAKVGLAAAAIVGLLNMTLLSALRSQIPLLFTPDTDVRAIVAEIIPLCAAFQLFDALAANCNGILRGLGRQVVGGYVQLVCYYAVAMPVSFGLAFGAGWGLWGLWTGVAIALGLVAGFEGWWISRTSWEKAVEEAAGRNDGT